MYMISNVTVHSLIELNPAIFFIKLILFCFNMYDNDILLCVYIYNQQNLYDKPVKQKQKLDILEFDMYVG